MQGNEQFTGLCRPALRTFPCLRETGTGWGGPRLCRLKALSQLWTTERLGGLSPSRLPACPPSPPLPSLLSSAFREPRLEPAQEEEEEEEEGCTTHRAAPRRAGLRAGAESFLRASGGKLGPCVQFRKAPLARLLNGGERQLARSSLCWAQRYAEMLKKSYESMMHCLGYSPPGLQLITGVFFTSFPLSLLI